MTLNQIIAHLPKLTQEELRLLSATIHTLIGCGESFTGKEAQLFGALQRVLSVQLNYPTFLKTKNGRLWAKNAPPVVSFIEATWGGQRRVSEFALMAYLLELLVDDMRLWQAPITVGSMTVNLQRIPQVFDTAFPGYRQGGLAHLILEKLSGRP